MDTVCPSETSVYSSKTTWPTWHYIPEDSSSYLMPWEPQISQIMRNFIICVTHHMLCGWSNKEEWDESCIQHIWQWWKISVRKPERKRPFGRWAGVAQSVWCLTTDWTTRVWSPAEANDFSRSVCVQTSYQAHATSCTRVPQVFPGGTAAVVWCWPLTSVLAIPPFPFSTCMACIGTALQFTFRCK
jgi:hypothetical protein